jgi:hypothetical protein
MESKNGCCDPETPVYGFLCELTNVFYAFETFEQYREFLGWLQQTSSSPQPNPEAMAS